MTMAPDYQEQKGSLTLRSDHMNYSRAVKNSNWHQARESEPKDYDISKSDVRDLCKTTYHRIGNVTDGTIPNTTYTDMSEQVHLKREFSEQEPRQHMINENTAAMAKLHRNGHNAVLPEHNPDHNKFHLETTHLADYKPPYPYESAEEKARKSAERGEIDPTDPINYTPAYKYCLSQFTDTANHRRSGWNTWQDESGVYANTHFKAQTPVYQRTKPIANRLK